jgi:4a-hydroxytetrahydrobiopterin dehydratase
LTRPSLLEERVVRDWLTAHPRWDVVDAHLVRHVKTADYESGVRLIHTQVALCDRLDHHPVVTLEYRRLRFELWTHDRGGLTQLDLDYAEGLDAIIDDDFADVAR